MAISLDPYLSFDGDAREAMRFYEQVFGGTLQLATFGDYGAEESPEKIMHGYLETALGLTFMGADTPPGTAYQPAGNAAMSLSGDDGEELRGYWERLREGGTVSVPLEKQMWGDEFGMCTDRFGVTWMVNISPPERDG